MDYVYASVLVALNAIALFLVAMGLPGTWLMVLLTALVAWWRDDPPLVSWWVVGVAAGLALLGEVLELLSGSAGARRSGGSRWGSVGALFGALAGAILGTIFVPVPVVGSIVGVCGGAFAGAALAERIGGRSVEESLRSGQGAAVGRLVGIAAKLAIGALIWLLIAIAAFWP